MGYRSLRNGLTEGSLSGAERSSLYACAAAILVRGSDVAGVFQRSSLEQPQMRPLKKAEGAEARSHRLPHIGW